VQLFVQELTRARVRAVRFDELAATAKISRMTSLGRSARVGMLKVGQAGDVWLKSPQIATGDFIDKISGKTRKR